MSKIPLSPDDSELGHLVRGEGPAFVLTGEDRLTIRPDLAAQYREDPGSMPMQVKSLRLPVAMVDAIEAVGHPAGFTGVIREALADWFAKREGTTPEKEAEQALTVLSRFVSNQASKAV